MQRDKEREKEREGEGEKEREREQFMTAVSTHIRTLRRLDVGGKWWVQAECRTSLFCRCV